MHFNACVQVHINCAGLPVKPTAILNKLIRLEIISALLQSKHILVTPKHYSDRRKII